MRCNRATTGRRSFSKGNHMETSSFLMKGNYQSCFLNSLIWLLKVTLGFLKKRKQLSCSFQDSQGNLMLLTSGKWLLQNICVVSHCRGENLVQSIEIQSITAEIFLSHGFPYPIMTSMMHSINLISLFYNA